MKKILFSVVLLLVTYGDLFAYLSQGNWCWRNNDGTEKTATWKAAQDSSVKITDNKAIRLRIDLFNAQSSTKGYGCALEYATATTGPWLSVSSAENAGGAFILAGNNAYISDNDTTSAQITEPGTYNFARGKVLTLSADHNDSLLVKQRKEYEWCIKPTVNIAPGTKYYFRAATGAGQTANLPVLSTANTFVSPPAILSNGSFEQGLAGWTNYDGNGGNTFALEDTAIYDGNTALRVRITNTGAANSTNVYTSHSIPFPASSSHIYLIRFWAKANVNAALLNLGLNDPANSSVAFKISTSWQRYQYAFKTSETSLIPVFYYLTKANYVLDDVTVLDDTDPVTDVNMTYMWQNNRPGYGWLTADGQESIQLPDGREAWFFSDTWLGINNPANNFTSTNQLVNNDMIVQSGAPPNGTLVTKFTGTSSSPQALMLPVTPVGAQYWYWPRDPVIENNTLKILLPEFDRPTANANPVYSNITSVATFSLPGLVLQKIENLPYLVSANQYTVLLRGDGQYNYVYGGDSSYPESKALVARYPKDQLSASVPWQFLSASGWVTDNTKATPISPYSFGLIIRLDTNNYAAVFEPNLSNSIDVMYAASPIGPWGNHTVLYQIPPLAGGLTYFAYLHKETVSNGIYTISYSSNTTIGQMLNDKGIYQPHFIKADLKSLSPYTVRQPNNYITSISAVSQGRQVIVQFQTSLINENHIEFQQSADSLNWNNLATVEGTDTTFKGNAFKATFVNPRSNGLNYYRLELFDEDNVRTISPVKSYFIHENATLASFTAQAASSNVVDLSFSTASELFNEGFIVESSTDSLNWKKLANILGAGTTTQTSNYQAADNSAVTGLNYYRIHYYSNGATVYSVVRKVDTRVQTLDNIALNVYPNPGTAAISFNLKAYRGKTFTATLTNLYGKRVDKQTFTVNADEKYTMGSAAPGGVYILSINGDKLTKSSRLLVQ